MKLLTSNDISKSFNDKMFSQVYKCLKEDMCNWQKFDKTPRHAMHYPHGVFELMPCRNEKYYAYKYVNCHPNNPSINKMSIVATGMLVDVITGYPLMFCDMTLLTAIRTAVTSVLAADYLAIPDAKTIGIIGTGAQSEFQTTVFLKHFPIKKIKFFDIDPLAMKKYCNNMSNLDVELVPCDNYFDVVQDIDILITAINEKSNVKLVEYDWVKDNSNLFINAIGGDCPGKTEIDPKIVENSRIVLEYYPQTKIEGEIQNLNYDPEYTELWELVQGEKSGRSQSDSIILFDSVGFALADFSIMRMMYEAGFGSEIDILPEISNPKNLFSILVADEYIIGKAV